MKKQKNKKRAVDISMDSRAIALSSVERIRIPSPPRPGGADSAEMDAQTRGEDDLDEAVDEMDVDFGDVDDGAGQRSDGGDDGQLGDVEGPEGVTDSDSDGLGLGLSGLDDASLPRTSAAPSSPSSGGNDDDEEEEEEEEGREGTI